jgi:hypothetical protein
MYDQLVMLLERILVLGDSHSQVFKEFGSSVSVVWVGGATAQGAANPNSTTNALNIYTTHLSSIRKDEYDACFVQLGEVDCNFVIWYRALKHNISIEEQVKNSIGNLFELVKSHVEPLFEPENIVIVAPHLPKVEDYSVAFDNIANERKKVCATLRERTRLTLEYSGILAERCLECGYRYLDIYDETLDKQTGLLKSEMLNHNSSDIHIAHQFLKAAYMRKIQALKPETV